MTSDIANHREENQGPADDADLAAPADELAEEYRTASDDRRLEMYLFHRELRALFDMIEIEA